MASDPHETPTGSPHVDGLDQTSRIDSAVDPNAGDFINPELEFDQFETELAAIDCRFCVICICNWHIWVGRAWVLIVFFSTSWYVADNRHLDQLF